MPNLSIDNTEIECVDEFNFLGITIHKHLKWDPHISIISRKIASSIGIIYKLKHVFPTNILITLYNTLILSYMIYGILLWGYNSNRIYLLQKKAIRTITLSKYLSHTEPIFKRLNQLKIEHIFVLSQLKFCFKLVNNLLPEYFKCITPIRHQEIHQHRTRNRDNFNSHRVAHVFAEKCIRFSVPHLLNDTCRSITDKIYTHSFNGFVKYVKHHFLNNYSDHCSIRRCYVCQGN